MKKIVIVLLSIYCVACKPSPQGATDPNSNTSLTPNTDGRSLEPPKGNENPPRVGTPEPQPEVQQPKVVPVSISVKLDNATVTMSNGEKYISAEEAEKATKKQTNSTKKIYSDVIITPQRVKLWSFTDGLPDGLSKKEKNEKIIHHKYKTNDKTKGVRSYALEMLMKAAKEDGDDLEYLIISEGMHRTLGISEEAEKLLEAWKQEGKITDYAICRSQEVPKKYKQFNKLGNTGVLLHTTC